MVVRGVFLGQKFEKIIQQTSIQFMQIYFAKCKK